MITNMRNGSATNNFDRLLKLFHYQTFFLEINCCNLLTALCAKPIEESKSFHCPNISLRSLAGKLDSSSLISPKRLSIDFNVPCIFSILMIYQIDGVKPFQA